jgi:hypothetical protein
MNSMTKNRYLVRSEGTGEFILLIGNHKGVLELTTVKGTIVEWTPDAMTFAEATEVMSRLAKQNPDISHTDYKLIPVESSAMWRLRHMFDEMIDLIEGPTLEEGTIEALSHQILNCPPGESFLADAIREYLEKQ